MKQHRYRITVEHLADAHGNPSIHAAPLQFETGNHDDILAIAQRMRGRGDFDPTGASGVIHAILTAGSDLAQDSARGKRTGAGHDHDVFT